MHELLTSRPGSVLSWQQTHDPKLLPSGWRYLHTLLFALLQHPGPAALFHLTARTP